ncbi:MAG: RNA helicase domain-containing protein [Firmicutes bacterium]|nr:RNA helicase domain-containing protein [Bacillota bacterium]
MEKIEQKQTENQIETTINNETDSKETKKRDTRSRSWLVTQSAEKISQADLITALSSYTWIGQLEKGEKSDYEHYQIYIENIEPIRFSTLKKKLPNAFIGERRGTRRQAYDYVTKTETRIGEPIGNGEINLEEEQGKRNDLRNIIMLLEEGASMAEIQNAYPSQFLLYSNRIKAYVSARDEQRQEIFRKSFRQLTTTYIWGKTGVGKTRFVMEKYGYENVYVVTNYDRSMWDTYKGQKVVLFDEFRSHLKISDILKQLDGYPLDLPARYNNKTACYDTVYIASNIPLLSQYPLIQQEEPETFEAFKRRIHYLWEFGKTEIPIPMPKPNQKQTAEQIMALGSIDEEDIFN